ncbi:MAG: Nramp family divalent metal transporter [Sphingosinicella sp.]
MIDTTRELAAGERGALPPLGTAELPAPPASFRKIIGPAIVASGVGLGSAEFILFPYIATQIGLTFLWAALLGVGLQYFLNMEIERYTLATGETVLTGFSRLGRHWGLVFVLGTVLTALWPGWTTSSAAMVVFLIGGGDARWIAVGMLIAVGAILTLSPVVYRTLEKGQSIKAAAVLLLILAAALFAIPPDAWAEAPAQIARPALPAATLGWALLLAAVGFAGSGGGANLCQSSWIRDKGFGMGAHAARIESPLTGEPVATPGTGWRFEPDAAAMARWRAWWRFANFEQLTAFFAMTVVTILFTSLLAWSLLGSEPGLPRDISFLARESELLATRVGAWFGRFFLVIGAFALFMTAVGALDITGRLAADCLRTSYVKGRSESAIYAIMVWITVAFGVAIIGSGASQPLVLLIVAGSVSGFMMFIYSGLLIRLNRQLLDPPLRPGPMRIAALVVAMIFFGLISGATILEYAGLLGGR